MTSETQPRNERIKIYLEKLKTRKSMAEKILQNSRTPFPTRIANLTSGRLTKDIETDTAYIKLSDLAKDIFVSSRYDSDDIRGGARELIGDILLRRMKEKQYNFILQSDQTQIEHYCYHWTWRDD
jgi:hypothetical protein